MTGLPAPGSRVSIRYRQPSGSDKSMTDVIGLLETASPALTVRPKSGAVVTISPDDVVAVRELSAVPVRASQIRTLEHAAAHAWPGTEHQWIDGWLLRAGGGHTTRANSAVPLDFSATVETLPAIIDWYAERDLPAWLALPERLLPIRAAGRQNTKVMTVELAHSRADDLATLECPLEMAAEPDSTWLAQSERNLPAEILTATVGGTLVFATVANTAVGRGAITTAPDGRRWLGISAMHTPTAFRRRGYGRLVGNALQEWGIRHGASHAYVQVSADSSDAVRLYESLGFRLHHHYRYVDARSLLTRRL